MKAINLKTLLIAVLFPVTAILNAKTDVAADTLELVVGNTVVNVDGIIGEQSNRYGAAPESYIMDRVYGLIKVFSPDLYQSNAIGTVAVYLDVYYEVIDPFGDTLKTTENKELIIEASESKVIDIAYFKAEGAQLIRATVDSVRVSGGPTWTDILLEVSVITDSYDIMNIGQPSVNLRHEGLNESGNLVIKWNDLAGAETYDLEWTYVSNQDSIEGLVKAPEDIEVDQFLFRNNSSRAEVNGNSYEIPMMYEKGYILYRLRGRGKRIVNGAIVNSLSEWTAPDGEYQKLSGHPSSNRYLYDGLEQNLNWQSILSFAEEGKHKAQVSYHDGSLRNRQTVTRINTDERSIVGEIFYDYHGRSVVNVLPVPDTTDRLEYLKNFNLIVDQPMLQKDDYSINEQGSNCEPNSFKLDAKSGASGYYSSNNPFTDSENNIGKEMINRNILPDAKQYPYTETKYTPDNTGRIAAQGGVGAAHQIGSGHETKYSYGSAQQEELSRLFGNQVGYFLHYKKNVTIDANGQVSVMYKNLSGNVIASTLVGAPPANVDSIEADTRTVINNLFGGAISPNMLSVDGKSKSYVNKFVVPQRNTYTFDYTGVISYHEELCPEEELGTRFRGVVDLDIKLIDGCGEVVFTAKDNTVKGNGSSPQTMENTNSVMLEKGEYVLSKELKINEEALEEYWQEYIASSPTCVESFDKIRESVIDGLELFGCNLTCDSCEFEIQKRINADPSLTEKEKEAMRSLCDGICDKEVGCSAHLNMMLGDLSPGGQYAKVRAEKLKVNNKVEASINEDGEIEVDEVDVEILNTDEVVEYKDVDEEEEEDEEENEENNSFNPSIYSLSIFNDKNNIPFSIFNRQLANDNNFRNPTWRYPISINVSGYPDDNFTNQVINSDSSLARATYSITDYMDENGDTVYAYITVSVVDGLYEISPEFRTLNGVVNIITVQVNDDLTGIYKIPIKYLDEAEDFVKYWQPHFSRYLLPYHPEYGYLVDCSENYRTSNDFDYKLSKTNTIDEAIEEGFILNKTPQIIGDTTITSMDPFLLDLDNYTYMKSRNNMFEDGHTMAEMATNAVNCARTNLDVNCPVTDCFNGEIDTNEEWIIYRSYYLSEKNALKRALATDKAFENFYYNGCIGNEKFEYEPAYLNLANTKREYIAPGVYRNCVKDEINTIGFQTWECTDYTMDYYWWYGDPGISFKFDPRQLCFQLNARKFKDKSKRFFIDNAESGMPKNCENVSTNNGKKTVVPKVCTGDLIEAVNESILDAQRYKYETCGTCPIADDLSNFIYDLIRNNKLISPAEEHLTCSEDKIHLQNELYRFLSSINPDIGWVSTVSSDGKTLNGKFIFQGDPLNSDTIAVTLSLPTLPIYATFNNLRSLCCFETMQDAPSPNTGKLFRLDGKLKVPYNFEVEVSGFIDLPANSNLVECNITPRCIVTNEAEAIASLLNTLSYAKIAKNESQLSQSSGDPFEIELMPEPNATNDPSDPNEDRALRKILYESPVRAILGFEDADNNVVVGINNVSSDSLSESYKPTWDVTEVTNMLLEGNFTYIENGTSTFIPITLSSDVSIDFSEILGFSRLQPYSGEGNENKFYVDALTYIGNLPSENVFVKLVVETPTIISTACFEPKLPYNIEN